MVEPSLQSMRLFELLSRERKEHQFITSNGSELIDSREIDTFIRINITFNSIGALSSRWPELAGAAIIKDASAQIPTMSIADLDTVCELLSQQATIIHYLRRRGPFEKNANYLADEMDLLAFYIDTGFNIGETEFDGTRLVIYGMSDRLNAYYRRQAEGQRPESPKLRRTRLFGKLISALEQNRPPRWTEVTSRLLDVAFDDQEIVEKNIKGSIARVKQSRESSMSWGGQISNGPPQRKQAIVFVWYRTSTKDEGRFRLRRHAEQTMEMAGTTDCLVIGFDVTRPNDPYSQIAIVAKPSGSTPPS